MFGLYNVLSYVTMAIVQLLLWLLGLVRDFFTAFLHPKKYEILIVVSVVLYKISRTLLAYKRETEKLKEINAKLAIDHEVNIAQKTIRFKRPSPDTYSEGTVVKGIHIIGRDFDMVINGMEIAGGYPDGRHRARVRGAEEWITFGSQLVINLNDITEEVVKAGGNVDLEWTLSQRQPQ